MDKYTVNTSMGPFDVFLNPSNLKNSGGKFFYSRESFKISQEGNNIIKGLYLGEAVEIIKNNDQLFLIIELDDPFYGSPEYLLNKE